MFRMDTHVVKATNYGASSYDETERVAAITTAIEFGAIVQIASIMYGDGVTVLRLTHGRRDLGGMQRRLSGDECSSEDR